MYIYMGVTADKYELPIYWEESLVDLAKVTNIKKHTLASYISKGKGGSRRGVKFIKITIDCEGE